MKKLATYVVASAALIAAPAFAADMVVKAPPAAPVPVSYSWTGFYVGLNAGWSWGKDDETLSASGPFGGIGIGGCCAASGFLSAINAQESKHADGAVGGVQVGYNWQAVSNWILGAEADIQASGENSSAVNNGLFSLSGGVPPVTMSVLQTVTRNASLLWFGTVRGRVGYAIWPTVMVYGTGGLAYGRFHDSATDMFEVIVATGIPVPLPNLDASVTKTGWTAGAGIEGAVANSHVTWKLEYLYIDLGTRNFTVVDPTHSSTLTLSNHFMDNIVRVGLNYQFH